MPRRVAEARAQAQACPLRPHFGFARLAALLTAVIVGRMPSIHPNVDVTLEQITVFCQKWQIVRFELFGSVIRDDFGPDSDVDVLVTFAPGKGGTLYGLLHMEDELKALFRRDVDLIQRPVIEKSHNYIRRKNILTSTQRVYAAG